MDVDGPSTSMLEERISHASAKLRIAEERERYEDNSLASHAIRIAGMLRDALRGRDQQKLAALGQGLERNFKEWATDVLRYSQPRSRPARELFAPWQHKSLPPRSAE